MGTLFATPRLGPFAVSPHMQAVPFDPFKDFTFIMQYGLFQYGIVVRSDSPMENFRRIY